MLRRLVQLHTALLSLAGLALLMAPGAVLEGLGIIAPSFPVLALSRVIVALLVIAAAAVLSLPHIPAGSRAPSLWSLTAAYGVATALLLVQETAIWNSNAGAIVVGIGAFMTGGFAWMARADRRRRADA